MKKRRVKKDKTRSLTFYYLGYIGQIGFSIAIPIAGGALLGTYLDEKQQSYPTMTLSFLFLGIVVSLVTFVKTIQEIVQKNTQQ